MNVIAFILQLAAIGFFVAVAWITGSLVAVLYLTSRSGTDLP